MGVVTREGWSAAEETVRMLCLAVCQLENAMSESSHSMDALSESFRELANHSIATNQSIQAANSLDDLQALKNQSDATNNEVQSNVSQAITAFQFYDRISQRLDHVARGLEKMSDIIADPTQFHDIAVWKKVQHEVKSSYSMEAERIMFEHVLRGASVKEALEIYRHHFEESTKSPDADGDEVELF